MIKIAICDDEPIERDRVHSFLKQYFQGHPEYDVKISCFQAPLELLYSVEESGGYDIYFMDVYMDGMIGTDAARQIRILDESGEIIFLTTSRKHAIDAFEVNAAQYLVKPYVEKDFFTAIEKVLDRLQGQQRHIITLKTSEGIVRLFIRDVIFTETGKNNYQVIHTIKGEKLEVRMTASDLFDLLSQKDIFVKCGAAINLNLKYVRQVRRDVIILDSGERLTYPYRSYQKIKEKFLQFQMSTEE